MRIAAVKSIERFSQVSTFNYEHVSSTLITMHCGKYPHTQLDFLSFRIVCVSNKRTYNGAHVSFCIVSSLSVIRITQIQKEKNVEK